MILNECIKHARVAVELLKPDKRPVDSSATASNHLTVSSRDSAEPGVHVLSCQTSEIKDRRIFYMLKPPDPNLDLSTPSQPTGFDLINPTACSVVCRLYNIQRRCQRPPKNTGELTLGEDKLKVS